MSTFLFKILEAKTQIDIIQLNKNNWYIKHNSEPSQKKKAATQKVHFKPTFRE